MDNGSSIFLLYLPEPGCPIIEQAGQQNSGNPLAIGESSRTEHRIDARS